jgi:hypothetical protein
MIQVFAYLIAQPFLHACRSDSILRCPVDDIEAEAEAVDLVENG